MTHIPESSDQAITMLQAREIIHGAFPLLFTAQPYLFPMEAYLTAPWVCLLPRNACGARLIPFLLSATACIGALWICRRLFSNRCRWPAYLLILFPAPYNLLLLTGSPPPSYAATALFSILSLACVVYNHEAQKQSAGPAMLAGLFSGLAASSKKSYPLTVRQVRYGLHNLLGKGSGYGLRDPGYNFAIIAGKGLPTTYNAARLAREIARLPEETE